ncbi:MAG TPA: ATP-binding protein [Gemmatimonadales bacterium]|jgi:signal transduction histidine kinase
MDDSRRRDTLSEMAEFPDMNPGPVFRLDKDGVIERANKAAKAVFRNDDLLAARWLDVCPGMTAELWAEVSRSAEPLRHETRVHDRCLVFTHAHRAKDDHVFVYGTDITELRDAQEALADQARALQELGEFPDMNPGPVLRLTQAGMVERANKAARVVFPGDTLSEASWLVVCPGMTVERWREVCGSREPVQHEALVGERCFVFTHVCRPASGHVFVFGSDITERRAAEREVAEMARFPEMNPGPVLRLDHDGRVLLANAAARGLFARPSVVGLRWTELCPGVDEGFWQRVLRATSSCLVEARVGGREMVFSHTPPSDGRYVFVYGADVTEQKNAETALRQTEKMATLGTLAAGVAHELNNPAAAAQRAAEHLRDEYAQLQAAQITLGAIAFDEAQRLQLAQLDGHARGQATCACDLDSVARSDREEAFEEWLDGVGVDEPWDLAAPLVDMNYSMTDLENMEQTFDRVQLPLVLVWLCRSYGVYRLLDEIHHGAGRVSEIVGALKSYSYLGQAPLQSVDVNEGVRNTLIILRSKLKQGIDVVQDLASDLPRIEAYGSELNQVWTNLIDNAVHAMDGAGTLRLRSLGDGDYVTVEVEDSGPGIPKEIQSQIFDAFFTTKPPGTGTGLGLHTCYSIVVKKHGGTLTLDSKPGSTRFIVRLPRVAVATG